MLAIEVNFLTGRFVAASHHDRGLAEWPPHPARLFSALVATWADSDDPDTAERNALEWLEAQAPPSIVASEAVPRTAVTHYVPVNDATVVSASRYRTRAQKVDDLQRELAEVRLADDPAARNRARTLEKALLKARDVTNLVSGTANSDTILPERRIRQARVYPSVTPNDPRVIFLWEDIPTRAVADALDMLLLRVTRLGHSSSFVSCRISSDSPRPSHVPSENGVASRWIRKGQLEHLEYEYAQHQARRPRTLPYTSVRYAKTGTVPRAETRELRPDTAGDWIVFEFLPASRRLPSTRTAEVARVLRAATFAYAEEPIPEGLSGHRADGTPSSSPHVAFLPLPHVGHEHADGRLMGIAIAMPESLNAESRQSLVRAIGLWELRETRPGDPRGFIPALPLKLGKNGVLRLTRQTKPSGLVALRPRVWSRTSRRWVSATPIALPTHPGPLGRGTAAARAKAWAKAEQAVAASCRHVGLPEPERVVVSIEPFIQGAHPARQFPAFRQGATHGRGVARRQVHTSVTFAEPVSGPLVLGAGRYAGLGLMRPVEVQSDD